MTQPDEGQTPASESRPAWLRRLFDRHAAAMELYARQWCCEPEDAVQHAFIQLACQPHLPDNPQAWLYRAVRNRAISLQRSAARRKHHESTTADFQPTWFAAHNGQLLDARAATDALANLPLDQREVIVAHLWGGLTFEQIAELCGCSSSTAHRRYLTGLAALRERMEK